MEKSKLNWIDIDQENRWLQALQVWTAINKKYMAINPEYANEIAKLFIMVEKSRGKQPLVIILRFINVELSNSLKVY